MLSSTFLEDLSGEILKIYEQIDQKVATFQKRTGLKCPPGCGKCCTSGNVKVAPLEFIPLARHLFQRGEENEWWLYLKEKKEGPCIFFQTDLSKAKDGHCKVYPWRAATCRLYGFGVRRNKYGFYEPITCNFLKADFYNVINDLCQKNLEHLFPIYDYYIIQIASLDPILSTTFLPVNQAIAKALEKFALVYQINSSATFFNHLDSMLHYNSHDLMEDRMKVNSRSKYEED